MARSIIVDVRTAVVAGIKAALEAHDQRSVSVTYGWQGGDDSRRREQVYTNRARATHDPAALKAGRNFRDERMDFDIVVLVAMPGKKPQEADERAIDIGQVVEEFIADHKSNELGVTGLQWLRMADMELNNMYAPNGSLTEITYTVRYAARLT